MNAVLEPVIKTLPPSDAARERHRSSELAEHHHLAVHTPHFLTGLTVLLVDDDQALLQSLTKVLKQLGARVLPAASVSAAIYYLTKGSGPLHLVLTDMRMPTVSGRCILSAMRGAMKHVPVIVMTAFATPTLRDECSALGASAFLEKPFDIRKLSEVISSVTEPTPAVEPE